MTSVHDFMVAPSRVMAFNACVMRLQVIGEHVGKLLKNRNDLLKQYPNIPWHAIYGMRNFISHEYANINENIVMDVINNELSPLLEAITDMLEEKQL